MSKAQDDPDEPDPRGLACTFVHFATAWSVAAPCAAGTPGRAVRAGPGLDVARHRRAAVPWAGV
ncbi:hypothetical protein [Cellulomonas sp. GbtcB1]|uniref:hypothetical protein n=1 Tax=Cellulomonas sp. GbtcB1 TaxID=2824746 RepID=UPI001C3088BB|nr:hypothetical protein [Cellulomonas sp. GbtcB1]